ncbi:MAG: 4-phosphoerythronate dehydrogenase [Bacteroidales bacterium]|nr:4-phosphoerythronate dehydrogenase [Bacteroidales bacterium]
MVNTHASPRIIIERNIPFAQGVLEPLASVSYLSASEITPQAMAEADALVTRTRTRCDSALLSGSPCSLIASATIGLDHVDLRYCRERGIEVVNAPGCNAPAVAQYVWSAILRLAGTQRLKDLKIGIVGVGHVGKIVEDWGRQLGVTLLLCDPPRQEVEGADHFVSLSQVAEEADVVTFHTPLTHEGPYATYHLAGASFFQACRRRPIIINAARGGVVDTDALISALESRSVKDAVIDCWEGEPLNLSPRLLQHAVYATPHIAGYSIEGKHRATQMALEAVSRHFSLTLPATSDALDMGTSAQVDPESILASYDPAVDTAALKSHPEDFESLRNHYPLRHELPSSHPDKK